MNSTIGPVDQYNQDIEEFNALTKAGGGAACYKPNGKGTPAPACPSNSILNPYYGMLRQPTLDPQGWYAPGLDIPYISPNTFAIVLNYRHGKFSVSPAMSLLEGTTYGTPADVQGLDPRACTANQGSRSITGGNPLKCGLYVLRLCSHERRHDSRHVIHPESADRYVRQLRSVSSAVAVQFRHANVV